MYKIDTNDATTTPPTRPSQSSPKHYKEGQTIASPWWLNMVQNEMCNVVTSNGGTLDKNDRTQLLTTINALIDAKVETTYASFYEFSVVQGSNTIVGRTPHTHVALFASYVDRDTGGGGVTGDPASLFCNADTPVKFTMDINVPEATTVPFIAYIQGSVPASGFWLLYPVWVIIKLRNLDTGVVTTIVDGVSTPWLAWTMIDMDIPAGRYSISMEFMSASYDSGTQTYSPLPTDGIRILDIQTDLMVNGITFIHPDDV